MCSPFGDNKKNEVPAGLFPSGPFQYVPSESVGQYIDRFIQSFPNVDTESNDQLFKAVGEAIKTIEQQEVAKTDKEPVESQALKDTGGESSTQIAERFAAMTADHGEKTPFNPITEAEKIPQQAAERHAEQSADRAKHLAELWNETFPSSGRIPLDRSERDPNGMKPTDPGAKLDHGKPKVAQILRMFARALWEVSKVGTYGADKYSMGGWQHVPDAENRYADAQMRHFLKNAMGEVADEESGLLHLAHEAWNALARLEKLCRDIDGCSKIEGVGKE